MTLLDVKIPQEMSEEMKRATLCFSTLLEVRKQTMEMMQTHFQNGKREVPYTFFHGRMDLAHKEKKSECKYSEGIKLTLEKLALSSWFEFYIRFIYLNITTDKDVVRTRFLDMVKSFPLNRLCQEVLEKSPAGVKANAERLEIKNQMEVLFSKKHSLLTGSHSDFRAVAAGKFVIDEKIAELQITLLKIKPTVPLETLGLFLLMANIIDVLESDGKITPSIIEKTKADMVEDPVAYITVLVPILNELQAITPDESIEGTVAKIHRVIRETISLVGLINIDDEQVKQIQEKLMASGCLKLTEMQPLAVATRPS